VRPPLAVVQRWRSGQRWQRLPKLACPDGVMRALEPAGQVTVPAWGSMVKSCLVNPPGTALVSGPGLIVWRCFAARSAARISPAP
jgi:hypothetical protein